MHFMFVFPLLLLLVKASVVFSHQLEALPGSIGTIYTLNASNPIQYQFGTHYATVEISPAIYSIIQGDFFMYNAVVKSGYNVPTFSKSPMTAIAAVSLNLTQVYAPQNTSNVRSGLVVSYKSWIPTFYNLDPTSCQLLMYDEDANTFYQVSQVESLEYGVSITIPQAFGKIITIGVFVYNEVEKISFSKDVSIYYPRSVMFSIGGDLRSLAYSFPSAKYYSSPSSGPSIMLTKYSSSGTVINSNYAVLGRFGYMVFSSGLNFTSAYISVQYQTTSDLFYDVSGGVVSVDPTSISCVLYIRGILYDPVSTTIKNGVLTCFLYNSYSTDHQLFITAKIKNPPTPPTPPTPTPSGSVPNPIIMVDGYLETVKLAKSQKVLFKLRVAGLKKVKFITTFSTTGLKPKFYIGKDYVPSSAVRDEELYSGEGTIYNLKSYSVSIYLLIANVDSQANNLYISPVVSDIDTTDPSKPLYVAWWVIVGPIAGVLACCGCFVATFIIVVVIRKRRAYNQQHNNIEFMSGNVNQPQTSQYYRVQ